MLTFATNVLARQGEDTVQSTNAWSSSVTEKAHHSDGAPRETRVEVFAGRRNDASDATTRRTQSTTANPPPGPFTRQSTTVDAGGTLLEAEPITIHNLQRNRYGALQAPLGCGDHAAKVKAARKSGHSLVAKRSSNSVTVLGKSRHRCLGYVASWAQLLVGPHVAPNSAGTKPIA
jgi:hypothetical protein